MSQMTHTYPENRCDLQMGDMGRGTLIPWDEFIAMDTPTGYEPYKTDSNGPQIIQVYTNNLEPTDRWWRGFIRKAGEEHFVIAVEAESGGVYQDPNSARPFKPIVMSRERTA